MAGPITMSEVAAAAVAAAGFGAAGVVAPGVTWSELWPPVAFVLTLLVGAIGTIWAMHQRELGALKDQIRAVDTKIDKLADSIKDLAVSLARDYTPRADVEKLRDELHRKAG